ncbi:MAG: PIN domain-containing protein [Bifidobacteriaceae bacterium]|nr:PIN domain-containing protein [Bifidobacteriaceae bacterium]
MSAAVFAVDTSLSVPFLTQTHPLHGQARAWARPRTLWLSGHAAAETYSVLTRLPGDVRLTPDQAAEVIDRGFAGVLTLPDGIGAEIHRELARAAVAGGSVYDALVALAAKANGAVLATRDKRAFPTYQAVGAEAALVAF